MLMIEVKQDLISALILLLNLLILEIATTNDHERSSLLNPWDSDRDLPSGHPPMHLITKSLNMIRHSQRFPKFLHLLRILIFRSKHADGDLDTLGVIGVDHSGVDFGGGREVGAGLGC